MTDGQNDAVWVFDSDCALCDWGVRFTLRYEKSASIRFVSIQSAAGRSLGLSYGVDPDDPGTFLFIENGSAREKSDAFIALARHLRPPAGFLTAIAVVPKPWRDRAYDWIARNRYRIFGRTDACIVPQPEVARRFTL